MVARDTSSSAAQLQEDILRRFSPAERLRMAFEMSEFARSLSKAGLLSRRPDLTKAELDDEMLWQFYVFAARRNDGRRYLLLGHRLVDGPSSRSAKNPPAMSKDLKHIAAEALELPLTARAELASQLLDSLDELTEDENDQLWAQEAERRYAEYKGGEHRGSFG